MKTTYHVHTKWCDGSNTAQEMIECAIEKGFDAIGFSSHVRLPDVVEGNLTPESIHAYVAEIKALSVTYADRIRVRIGIEADYIPGVTAPEYKRYACVPIEYMIGSVHCVKAPDGAFVPVDHEPGILVEGIRDHFGGDVEKYLRTYFAQQRDMAAKFDFDVLGHADLVRKFNGKLKYFDENDAWYRDELIRTADAIAASGKIVEVNTGGISRGWMEDAYPSPFFRALLRERGVKFILSSDAHFTSGLDCAFDRFAAAESWVDLFETGQ